METIIGFVAGYLAGSREGKEGLQRLRSSWQAIKTSPEVRRLAGEALSVAGGLTKQASRRSLGTMGNGIVSALTGRVAGDRQPGSHAA